MILKDTLILEGGSPVPLDLKIKCARILLDNRDSLCVSETAKLRIVCDYVCDYCCFNQSKNNRNITMFIKKINIGILKEGFRE